MFLLVTSFPEGPPFLADSTLRIKKIQLKLKQMKKLIFSCLVLSLLLIPVFVLADAPACDGVICNPLGQDATITTLIDKIINFFLFLAGPIAVIMVVYAGFLLITGGDKPEQVKKARQTLMWVVIGLIVLIFSKSVVGFVNSMLK